LFTFGRAAITAFNNKMSQGKARLDFARPENREFWLAGYQYIKSLLMKGTYRTALEWAKLLLSLDLEADPYSMLLMIHHLAIRAREFQWLLDLYPKIKLEQPGSQLSTVAMMVSVAYAAMSLRDAALCRTLLTDAMENFPWLFVRLFKELNLDAPKTIWGQHPRTDAEALITELYVHQAKDLWSTSEATSLLMEIAHTIPKIDPDPACPKLSNDAMSLDVVRFIYLENTPALMSLAPSQLLHRSNNSDADPLPPDHNIFSYAAQRSAVEGREPAQGGLGDDLFDPLAALARLLPGFRRPEAENREEQEEAINRVLEELAGGETQDGLSDDTGDSEGEEGDRDANVAPGMISRLLNMLWRSGNTSRQEGADDEGTDDGTPDLIDAEEGEGDDETDDEMPELVNAE
jgi:Transcriptional repressor TCF25